MFFTHSKKQNKDTLLMNIDIIEIEKHFDYKNLNPNSRI
jgi:hypothetical protein